MADYIKEWQEADKAIKTELRDKTSSLRNADANQLDLLAQRTNEAVVSCIDCLQCANCCKTTPTTFTEADIRRASKYIEISKKEFIKKYLILDLDGTYTTITTPCPFLLDDNKCKIYDARPEACSSFPHTQRNNFKSRLNAHKNNIAVCPITYHVLKRMVEEM